MLSFDIQRNMETLDTSRYPPGEPSQSIPERVMSAEQLRHLLEALISSSNDLNLRVWLDGVYTDVENTEINNNWIDGREVYFKVEGRVDRMKRGERR